MDTNLSTQPPVVNPPFLSGSKNSAEESVNSRNASPVKITIKPDEFTNNSTSKMEIDALWLLNEIEKQELYLN